MTNLEKLKNELNVMSLEEFVETLSGPPWCGAMSPECQAHTTCDRCGKAWAEREYKKPMPELCEGTFVEVENKYTHDVGIIIRTKYGDLAVAYPSGGWDKLDNVTIVAIYDASCFNDCMGSHAIWRSDF